MERKSSFGRSWGRLLRFLGVSEGCCFSMRFLISKKSAQNREILDNWWPKGARAKNEVTRRNARGHRGGDYGEGAEIFA